MCLGTPWLGHHPDPSDTPIYPSSSRLNQRLEEKEMVELGVENVWCYCCYRVLVGQMNGITLITMWGSCPGCRERGMFQITFA